MSRIRGIEIDGAALPPSTPEIEQERRVAVADLLEENRFDLPGRADGPYDVTLGIREGRLVMDVAANGAKAAEFHLALSPFRQVVKDYFQICKAYFEAAKSMPPSQIEAIDMARRGIHDEGGRVLMERLDGKAELDHPTARRLFTLICVLHLGR